MSINVTLSDSVSSQYPLSYDDILQDDGFYEPENRPDVRLFVTQASPNTGERDVLTVKGEKGLAYPASGWGGRRFRKVSASLTLSS